MRRPQIIRPPVPSDYVIDRSQRRPSRWTLALRASLVVFAVVGLLRAAGFLR